MVGSARNLDLIVIAPVVVSHPHMLFVDRVWLLLFIISALDGFVAPDVLGTEL